MPLETAKNRSGLALTGTQLARRAVRLSTLAKMDDAERAARSKELREQGPGGEPNA